MRDTRSGGNAHARLNHRQQQVVHAARELVQAPHGSKQHKDAATRLASLRLSEHELQLAARAAKQHREHLDRMQQNHAARLDPASAQSAKRWVTDIFPARPRLGMSPIVEHQVPVHHLPDANAGDVILKSNALYDPIKKTGQKVSPVVDAVLGPSISAFARGDHASLRGLALDTAMLVDPTKAGKVVRGADEAYKAIRAGAKGIDVLRAAKAAGKAEKAAPEVAKSVAAWKKTRQGKATVAELKAHPERANLHAQIDAYNLSPAEKKAIKQHVDHQVTVKAHQTGMTVDQIMTDPIVQDALAPFHSYSPDRALSNLRSKLNPRMAERGLQGNAPLAQDGQHVLGAITPTDWVARVLHTIPDPVERAHLATWYHHVVPLFIQAFGDDAPRILRGFAVSQANASPTFGLQAVLRVADKVDRGLPVSKDEISAVSKSIEAAVKGDPVEKGVAAKLSDFIDSLQNRDTRTWMGHDPSGGLPSAIDIHALRDLGYVDKKLVTRLEKRGLVQGKDFFVDSPGVAKGPMYERAAEQYQGITDHLNEIHFDGRTDWKPSEVQALGWSSIQKFHGTTPEDLAFAIENNTREIMGSANERQMRKILEDQKAYPQEVTDGSARALVSPENGREIAQRIADDHGEARMLWLTNQSQARHVLLTVNGDITHEQVKRIIGPAGFKMVHESEGVTRFLGAKRDITKAKLQKVIDDARAEGLNVDHQYTQMEEFHAGEGQRHHIPGGPTDSPELMARRAELRGRVHFTEGGGPVHVGEFLDAISRNPRASFLTAHTPDELRDARVFLSHDGEAGFAISKEGDLQNVFNNVKGSGAGPAAVKRAISEGAVTLDAFDGYLPEFYANHGFVETGRMKWVDEYAPEGWDYEKMGRPDVVFMGYHAKPGLKYYDDFDMAKQASRDALLSGKKPPRDRGLSSGINPGFDDNTEKGLIGDWFSHLRGGAENAPEAQPPVEPHVPTPDELAAGKVLEGMKGVPTKQREQAAIHSEVRGERAGLAEEAMRGVQGLEEKIAAAHAELEGALPKLQHDGIRGLNENEINRVTDLIENHPDLRFYERLNAMDALRNAWADGTMPTPRDLKLLKRALGPQVSKEAFKPTNAQKYKHRALELMNMPRSLMASFDISAPFRQGLVAFGANPILSAKNLKPMLHYFGSEHGYQDLMKSIDERPNRDLYSKAKLAITDVEHSLTGREEQFMSNYAEALKVKAGTKKSGEQRYIGPGNTVRRSGRAYTGFLVKTRADMFDFLLEKAAKQGHDITDEKLLKNLGSYVNAATGRGDLKHLEGAATVLNSTFFSPRLMASRFTFLNPLSYRGLHPFVRQQKIKAAFQTATMIGGALYLAHLGGAKVGFDPFNADFGKAKIGDTRFDFSGGFAGYTRLMGALGMAMTGHDPNHKFMDSAVRFFRGKLAPIPAVGVDIGTHTDYSGYRTPKWGQEATSLFIPLLYQDASKVVGNKGSIGMIAAATGASAVGVGVNTYKATPSRGGSSKKDPTTKFNEKYQKTVGKLPLEVRAAEETKTMYESAEKRRKDELGVSSLTDEQRTYVKLAVLGAQHPELKDAIGALRQSLDEPNSSAVAQEIDSWAEDQLGWRTLEAYQAALR